MGTIPKPFTLPTKPYLRESKLLLRTRSSTLHRFLQLQAFLIRRDLRAKDLAPEVLPGSRTAGIYLRPTNPTENPENLLPGKNMLFPEIMLGHMEPSRDQSIHRLH
jgi:hypothetical protein